MNAPSRRSLPLLLSVLFAATSLFAQVRPSEPNIPEGVQKALDAPVWHLNYRIVLKLSGERNELIERTTTGSMMLGLRTQGPSLSAQDAAARATTAEGMESFFRNYANWMSGVNFDDNKTDEQNEAELKRVLEANRKAHHIYRWQYSGPDHVGGTARGSASGSGTVEFGHHIALELDAAKRRFKLAFAVLVFRDTESTQKAFTGVDEHGIGSIHYQRIPIERPLYPDHQSLDKIDPPLGKFFEGPIPEAGGNLSYSSTHTVTDAHRRGTLAIEFTLSPHPPIPVELWIDPPNNYQRWQPIADKDEQTAGDIIPIKIVLQKPGGGAPQFKPTRYEFLLLDTSREKGICLNWPPPAPLPAGANDPPPPYDLQFEADKNDRDMWVSDEGQRLVETIPTKLEREVMISCFDYGAYGDLIVHAMLENGQLVEGIVRGTKDQKVLPLPARKDGSKIATIYLDNNGVANLADDDDNENDPVGDRFKGDGLTLYEEYRGFMVGDAWTPGTPKKKDVFVINELRGQPSVVAGVKLFESLTSLKVHDLLRDNQVLADGRINFNRTSAPHVVDQHAIRIEAGEWLLFGNTAARVTGNVGTPDTAKTVSVPPDLGIAAGAGYMASTVAHEMLHSCNVYHHGERDRRMRWFYRPGEGQIYEEGLGAGRGHPVPIMVKHEGGRVIAPSVFFAPGETEKTILLGLKHGQHSGAEECVMRYDIAFAYPSSRDPIVRYLTGGEPVGKQLCRSPAGTGVNGPRDPHESRYETAANAANGGFNPDGTHQVINDRGNCAEQVRVNDKDNAPRR